MGSSRSSAGCVCAPRRLAEGPARAVWRLAGQIACFTLGAVFLSAAHPEQAQRVVHVRFEWRSEKSACWAGVLETSQGTIADPASLGVCGSEAGTLWADGKCLWLARRTACDRDGFEVTVIAPLSAHLSFTLQAAGTGGPRQRFECLLSDLEGDSRSLSGGQAALQLTVRRAPGDALRVVVDRHDLIYRPGETFQAKIVPDVLAANRPPADARLTWWLSSTRNGETINRGTIRFGKMAASRQNATGGVSVEIPLPKEEGAVALHFRLLGSGPSELRSSVQLLVLADRTPRDSHLGPAAETLIDRLTAEDVESTRRLAAVSGQAWVPARHAGFNASGPETPEAASGSEPHVDWTAVRLRLKHPQAPHRLVLHVAAGSGSFLGVSLLEPDARGQLSGRSLDTGLSLADSAASDDSSAPDGSGLTHEVLFWPQVVDPVLLLHDLAGGRRPRVTGIEIYELAPPPTAEPDEPPRADERLIGPYLAKALLPENFGGPKVFDERAAECLEDWETFHAAAMHVADYLVYNGYNSLLIAALCDGTTIYPSACVEPTRRYDSGALSAAQAPIRKDFLELLYRIFDRERLTLIPELQFDCPLPGLERQLVDGASAEGIELIGADGRAARDQLGRSREPLPIYNPLDPRVQQAVLSAVREIVERYRHHPSFGGVALEISRTGYLDLPGLDWGYDTATVRHFEHDSGVNVDGAATGDMYAHRHAVLAGEARAAWIRWRCQEMARFYQRLADALNSTRPNARLILACKQVLPDPATDEQVRREIRVGGRLADLLAERGIDFSLLGEAPRLVVLKSSLWHASGSTDEGLLDEALSQTASFGSAFRFSRIGTLGYRPPRRVKVANFGPASPWQAAGGQAAGGQAAGGQADGTRLEVEASPGVRESRRRFIRGLAENDAQMIFDGGCTVPLGQERATAHLRQIARAIPPIPFYKVEAGDESALVQTARHNKKTYIYAVNRFAQPCELSLVLSCPPGTPCRPLGPSPSIVIRPASGDSAPGPSGVAADGSAGENANAAASEESGRFKTTLDAYGLAAWEIDHEDARVIGVQTQLPPAELAQVQARVARFQRQLAQARRSAQVEPNGASTSAALPAEKGTDAEKGETIATVHEGPAESGALVLTAGRGPGRGVIADAAPEVETLSADDLRQLAKISLQLALAADENRIAECQSLLDGYWCRYLALRAESGPPPALFREAARPVRPASR